MKRAAIYARKSKITEKGDSIDNQIKLCSNYLSTLDISEVSIYSDEGFSGKNTDRPQFKKLLNDAKEKKFDIIICYKLDRISRNVSDFSTLITNLEELNISFISVVEQFDTSTAMGKAMMYITSVFSQLERETISQRIMDNMYALAEKGYWLGGEPPTGYTSKRISEINNGKEHTYAILDDIPEEIELVKLIFSKYLTLGSLSQVEKYLLSNNIKTKRDKDWTKTTIKAVLENPCYVKSTLEVISFLNNKGITTYGEPDGTHGLLIYKKRRGKSGRINSISEWIYAISNHKGIIEGDQWINVQELLESNKNRIPALGTSNNAILSGIVSCKQCGSPMRVAYGVKSKNEEKKNYYYMCTLKHNSGKTRCSCKNVNGQDLDEVILEKLKQLSIDRKILVNELTKYNDTLQTGKGHKALYEIINEINKNDSIIDNLIVNVGLTTDTEMVKLLFNKIDELKNTNLRLNTTLENINDELKQQEQMLKSSLMFSERLRDISAVVDTVDTKEKKRLVSSVIERVYVDGDTGAVKVKFKNANII